MIYRKIQGIIEKRLFKKKAIIIYGARQVGKTTLIKMISEKMGDFIYLNCDEPDIRTILSDATSTKLKEIIGRKKLVLIDEAQRVKNIGITLKLFVDELNEWQVIATGSSSIELANEINEPLTGRKYEFYLYPFSMSELSEHFGWLGTNRLIEDRIIYGMYPEVTLNPEEKKDLIKNIASSYLYKDILSYKDIRKPDLLDKLLRAIAHQIGKQVSYQELSNTLKVDDDTIAKYIELLEKAFIIFRLPPFSRNLRTEITKMRKIYFYDTGVRNAVISDFRELSLRQDIGSVWENFLIMERIKSNSINSYEPNYYFWRTQQQQEIDFIEEYEGNLKAFEFKWSQHNKKWIPRTFTNNYPEASTQIIDRENYQYFLRIFGEGQNK